MSGRRGRARTWVLTDAGRAVLEATAPRLVDVYVLTPAGLAALARPSHTDITREPRRSPIEKDIAR